MLQQKILLFFAYSLLISKWACFCETILELIDYTFTLYHIYHDYSIKIGNFAM